MVEWETFFIYGNPEPRQWKLLWNAITKENNFTQHATPKQLIGDFNDVMIQEEKVGLHPKPNNQLQAFRTFVSDNALMDLDLK
ncbi:hypothetical protein PIB30_097912, partial [Stylosanthes scabra]|nr:hypothetical protein [Stylosanthes scabra]